MKFKTMGKTIEIARNNLGISQWSLAEHLGWTTGQFISNIERGQASIPIKDFKKFAKVLKVNVDLLVKAYLTDIERQVREEL